MANAIKLYEKSCSGKYIKGCYYQGSLEEKRGNMAIAKKLYKKSCDAGLMGGCSALKKLGNKRDK